MKKEILSFKTDNKNLLKYAFQIRTTVFINEQNCSYEEEFDGFDEECIHYLITVDNIPAACARRRQTEEGHKAERFAVLKNYRGLGLGAMLLEQMLFELSDSEETIYLHAQANVESFYKKYGFKREGDLFTEANIDHYKMIYKK